MRAAYPPMPWQIAQRARAADVERILDDVERRLSRLSNMLPSVASAPKVDRVSDTIASALNEIADRFSSRTRSVSKDAGRMGERFTADAMQFGKFAPNRRLLVVGISAGEDEVIIGDGGLPGKDRVAAGDLIERVDGKGRRAVGCGKQIAPDAEGTPRPHVRVFVDPVSPDDLLRAAEPAGGTPIGPFDPWPAFDRLGELAPSDGNDAAGPADLLFFRGERHGCVALFAGLVCQPTRRRQPTPRRRSLRRMTRKGPRGFS